jgi:hypothetical protein
MIPTNDYETMFNKEIKTLGGINVDIKRKAIQAAKERVKLFTWDNAASKWFNFLQYDKKQLWK